MLSSKSYSTSNRYLYMLARGKPQHGSIFNLPDGLQLFSVRLAEPGPQRITPMVTPQTSYAQTEITRVAEECRQIKTILEGFTAEGSSANLVGKLYVLHND